MKLTFVGTRGAIEARTRRHRMHTALEVSYCGKRVRIDCGEDWRAPIAGRSLRPPAIVLTHAHPDHVGGLAEGVSCPVWATAETWKKIDPYPIEDRRTVSPREPFGVRSITFEAFPVEHSTRAPAVGYRITAGAITVFYAPDLVSIHDRAAALAGCAAYIGDGATMKRSFVRKRGDALIGHAPVETQLGWCEKERVPRAVVTHCGRQIVAGDERILGARLRAWAEARGVAARFAYDGLEMVLR